MSKAMLRHHGLYISFTIFDTQSCFPPSLAIILGFPHVYSWTVAQCGWLFRRAQYLWGSTDLVLLVLGSPCQLLQCLLSFPSHQSRQSPICVGKPQSLKKSCWSKQVLQHEQRFVQPGQSLCKTFAVRRKAAVWIPAFHIHERRQSCRRMKVNTMHNLTNIHCRNISKITCRSPRKT